LRGIATSGLEAPSVGLVVDDIPIGSQTGTQLPEIDPGDLERVEVLRGPQGTLYGANSVSGLLKYVTKTQSTERYSGRIEAGSDDVQNGAEPGFNSRGSANIPLTGDMAVRISGFKRQDPGYIDNPHLNLKGVNEGESDGARLAALWKPSDDFSVKLGA